MPSSVYRALQPIIKLRLYLIRHPEPDIAPSVCYGQLDIPATTAALNDCLLALLPQLAHLGGVSLYSSPLRRCAELAQAMHAAMPKSTLVTEHALMELNFGAWEGRSWDDIYANDRHGLDAWASQPLDFAPGGGESLQQLHQRVMAWLVQLQQSGCESAIAVTHGGPLRVLLSAHENNVQAACDMKAPALGSLNIIKIPL